jgi:hypothetical protein
MTRQRLKIIAFCVIIVEILALILLTFGFYTRLAGAGNPVGSIYMIIAIFLIAGGGITIYIAYIASRKRRPVPKEETITSERYTEKQGGGISDDQETENPHSFL